MTGRQAFLIVADDVQVGLTGKLNIHGVYTGDIGIPNTSVRAPQLVFIFVAEADLTDPFRSITLEVTIPGNDSRRVTLPVPPIPQPVGQGRTRQTFRHPFLVQWLTLKPGHIEAKVIHEKGEIVVSSPWITQLESTPPAIIGKSEDPTRSP